MLEKAINRLVALVICLCFAFLFGSSVQAARPAAKSQAKSQAKPNQSLNKINHVIVFYMENWSFDGLYGLFDGVDGIFAIEHVDQVSNKGKPYKHWPHALNNMVKPPVVDERIPVGLVTKPYDLLPYIGLNEKTGDMMHRFYNQKEQINLGKMDKFIALSLAGSLPMSYYDAHKLPLGKWASEYTLCDHFFHAAFGGSWLNNCYLLAASPFRWDNAPEQYVHKSWEYGRIEHRHVVSEDGFIVNNPPPPQPKGPVPLTNHLTICDRLDEKGISWAWYGDYSVLCLDYTKKYAQGTKAHKSIRKLDSELLFDLKAGKLPQVCFIHQVDFDEHPGLYAPLPCEEVTDKYLQAIKNSKYWNDSLVIITYDENGGRWDHVPPPKRDFFGPGTRVPTLIIGPFAKKHFVDHTEYDTTSILKFIESRWGLKPLTDCDAKAANMTNALSLTQ